LLRLQVEIVGLKATCIGLMGELIIGKFRS